LRQNKRGLKLPPCGTPKFTSTKLDEIPLSLMNCFLSERYE